LLSSDGMNKKLLLALSLVCSSAFAEGDLQAPHLGVASSDTDRALETAGTVLMSVSAASALAATTVGPLGFWGVRGSVCGIVEESCNDAMFAAQDRLIHAGIGLGALAALTAVVGIPLYSAGHHRVKKQALSLSVTPTFGAQGAGMSGSFAARF
jgi:hypothetical protein